MRHISLVGLLASGLFVLAAPSAFGQGFTGGSGSGGSGFTGSSGGSGFTGGSGGSGFTGGSGGSGFAGGGTFAGGSGGFSGGMGATTSSQGRTTGGRTQYGQTSPLGRYYGNPYAAGMSNPLAAGQAAQYARTFPVTLSFGVPVYDVASVTRTTTTGLTGLGGLGTTTTTTSALRFAGASSAGIRRAPGYVAEPVFDPPQRPRTEVMQGELQSIIDRSSRLPSRDAIRVTTDGETVTLRGQVRDERERRLAEAVIRLTPGVHRVRNELQTPARR